MRDHSANPQVADPCDSRGDDEVDVVSRLSDVLNDSGKSASTIDVKKNVFTFFILVTFLRF